MQNRANECARLSNKRTYNYAWGAGKQDCAQAHENKSFVSGNGIVATSYTPSKAQINLNIV